MITVLDYILVLVFAVGYPLYALIAYRKIKPALIANKPGVRERDYKETILWLWVLAVLAILVWLRSDRLWADIGLDFTWHWSGWVGIGLITAGAAMLIWLDRSLGADVDQQQALREKFLRTDAYEFAPQQPREFKWFLLLSITAGICEEILFRGYLIWYFETFSSTWVAVILSSVLFGTAHAYQGLTGVVRTGIVGLVMAALYVFTGTLWIPIAVHIVFDVYSGVLSRNAFKGQ